MKKRILNQNTFWGQIYASYERVKNVKKAKHLVKDLDLNIDTVTPTDYPASSKQAYMQD